MFPSLNFTELIEKIIKIEYLISLSSVMVLINLTFASCLTRHHENTPSVKNYCMLTLGRNSLLFHLIINLQNFLCSPRKSYFSTCIGYGGLNGKRSTPRHIFTEASPGDASPIGSIFNDEFNQKGSLIFSQCISI